MQGRYFLILALTVGFLALSGATLLSALGRIESIGAPAIPPTPVERTASPPRPAPVAAARSSVPAQRALSPRIQRRVLRGQVLLAIAADRDAVDDCLPEDLHDFGGATLDLEIEVLDGRSRIAKVEIEDSGTAESSVLECACDALRGQLLSTPIAKATDEPTRVIYPLDARRRPAQHAPAAPDIME
jgi:hypothetical protein